MGTSTSHPSPNRPAWNSLRRLLKDETVPPERAMNELWSVALRDADAPILDQLSSPVVYELARISSQANSPDEAARLATRTIARSKANSVIVELAKRALVGSMQQGGEPPRVFAQAVFAEVTGYIASRDLSGMMGSSPHLKDATAAIAFKAGLKSITTKIVGRQEPKIDSPQAWTEFIKQVASALSGGRA